MALKITVRRIGDVSVLDCEGKITKGTDGDYLRNELRRMIREGRKKFLINLTKVERTDGTIVSELMIAKANGSDLIRLIKAPKNTQAFLKVIDQEHVFKSYETEKEALQSIMPTLTQQSSV